MAKIDVLFRPKKIGNLEIKNRFVMAPMMTRSAEGGMVTQAMANYYAERAKGGTGLIIVEFTKCESQIEPVISPHHLRIDNQEHQDAFNLLTDAIHSNGAKAALQITPGMGSWVLRKAALPEGYEPVGPTTFASAGQKAHPLATEEVEAIVQSFGAATARAKNAGFDAVEIHGHSSYLLGQFMSPFVNTRKDKYGDLWRLPVELLQAAKTEVGADYPIIFRISGDEFIEGGRNIQGTVEICKRMEEAGVECIHVSDGTYYTPESNLIFPYMTLPRATYEPECKEIRKAVNIPLILAGRLSNPDDALRVVEEGTADFVAVGRGLIADSGLPNKIAERKTDEIRPCLSCNYCISTMIATGSRLQCAVNFEVFKEGELKIVRTEKPKKVVVIGGGPGGMEAARVAAMRGHSTTLYEKEERLGGYLTPASIPEHKKDIRPLIAWLSSEVKKAGVNVLLDREVSVEQIVDMRPDIVIIAVGATPQIPDISGVERPFVVSAIDVLLEKVEVGDVVVVAGGGLVGCDVAAFLADKGKKVTIVEMLSGVAVDVEERDGSRGQVLKLLKERDVTCRTEMKLEEIEEMGVNVSDKEGVRHTIQANTVVLSLGFEPRTELYEALKDKLQEVYAIGDCKEVGKIGDAIRGGAEAGWLI